jgi:predicted nucleic acid-binding Zn ribbon protein
VEYCPNCGKKIEYSWSFCEHCGKRLIEQDKNNKWFQGSNLWFLMGLAAIVIIYLSLLLSNINRPFIAANEDDNAVFGLAAYNLAKFGFIKLKFGMVTFYSNSVAEIGKSFYTHHPQFLVLPTAVLYRLFGVSDAVTRLSSIIFSAISLVAFYFTVYLFYKKHQVALLSTAAYAFFPGIMFYNQTLSEKVFIVVFSNFAILSFFILQNNYKRLFKLLFIFIIFYGGLQGWHFYFVSFSLWLYTMLNRKVIGRKFLLFSLPITSILSFAFNILHFYILKGSAFLPDLISIFKVRSLNLPLAVFIKRYSFFIRVNFTLVAGLAGLGYLVYLIYAASSGMLFKRKYDLHLIYLIQPLLVILAFRQWSGIHAFGPIYWAQFLALSMGLMLYSLFNAKRGELILLGSIVVAVFIFLAANNIRFFNKPSTLSRNDVKLLRELSQKLPSDVKIARGKDFRGFAYQALLGWYLKRDIRYDWQKNKVDIVLAFNPKFSPFNLAEFRKIQQSANYKLTYKSDSLWVLSKK